MATLILRRFCRHQGNITDPKQRTAFEKVGLAKVSQYFREFYGHPMRGMPAGSPPRYEEYRLCSFKDAKYEAAIVYIASDLQASRHYGTWSPVLLAEARFASFLDYADARQKLMGDLGNDGGDIGPLPVSFAVASLREVECDWHRDELKPRGMLQWPTSPRTDTEGLKSYSGTFVQP